MVRQHPYGNRKGEGRPRPAQSRLRAVARTSAAHSLPRQCHPLQLALVHQLGDGRDLQQRHARDRRRPLDTRRRLSDERYINRRKIPLRRRLAVSRYPGSHVRIRGREEHHLAGAKLQRTRPVRAFSRNNDPWNQRQSGGRPRWLRRLRSEEQDREAGASRT